MRRSKRLLQIGSKEAGLSFSRHCLCPFLWTGTAWVFFHAEGNFLSFRESSKIIDSGLHNEFPHNFIIRILSISWLWALFGSELFINLKMSSVEKLTVSSDSFVSFARLLGDALLLCNRVHWFGKKVLKISAFSLKL